MQKDILKIANHFGLQNQMAKCQEELAELIQAIAKINIEGMTEVRYNNLTEEIADVEIMIEQIKTLNCINTFILQDVKREKVNRTLRRFKI